MPSYIQIENDPTKWWPTEGFQASQLTGQPLTVPVSAPAYATLVLSGKAGSVAVFEVPSSQASPDGLELQVPSIYLPTAAGMSAGHVGYALPTSVNVQNLADQILAAMRGGHNQTITLSGGGTLVLNGATLSFVVLVTPIVLGVGGSRTGD
jgi:hypothetical protein